MRSYSELVKMDSFLDRFNYLKLNGAIGDCTFGFDRWLNQVFYNSGEWKEVKRFVIERDRGYDLGHSDYEISGRIVVHHMNPVEKKDIVLRNHTILDPEYLISVSHNTHNALHYGSADLLPKLPVERKPNDTCPWR